MAVHGRQMRRRRRRSTADHGRVLHVLSIIDCAGRAESSDDDGVRRACRAQSTAACLDGDNPELLQMAHYFASAQDNYLGVMQGFALLYTALLMQSEADSLSVH